MSDGKETWRTWDSLGEANLWATNVSRTGVGVEWAKVGEAQAEEPGTGHWGLRAVKRYLLLSHYVQGRMVNPYTGVPWGAHVTHPEEDQSDVGAGS